MPCHALAPNHTPRLGLQTSILTSSHPLCLPSRWKTCLMELHANPRLGESCTIPLNHSQLQKPTLDTNTDSVPQAEHQPPVSHPSSWCQSQPIRLPMPHAPCPKPNPRFSSQTSITRALFWDPSIWRTLEPYNRTPSVLQTETIVFGTVQSHPSKRNLHDPAGHPQLQRP